TTFVIATKQAAGTAIHGGAGSNTLVSANVTNTWRITGANAGSINGLAFSGVGNLTGGSGKDTFLLVSGGSVSGVVAGGGGTTPLNYSATRAGITVDLQRLTATSTGGFTSIQSLVGSSSAADTLIGADTANTWNLAGANGGKVNGVFTYSGIENLTG